MEQDLQEFRLVYIHGRANLKTLILYQNEGAVEKATKIENYYGFEKGISGSKLYQTGIKQAINIGVEVKKQEVIKIQIIENGFEIKTNQDQYQTKSIILATGNKKNRPNIKNIEKFEGKGVSYCAICDGFFYRNKDIAVIGSGNYALSEVNELINLVGNITILTNGEEKPKVRIKDKEIRNYDTAKMRSKSMKKWKQI